MKLIKQVKPLLSKLSWMAALMLISTASFASTTDQYPWTQTLSKIMDSISGPVAYAAAGICVVLGGLIMAFTDLQGGAKTILRAFLGISIAFGVSVILSTMFTIPSAVIG